jgi:hypothetical protein
LAVGITIDMRKGRTFEGAFERSVVYGLRDPRSGRVFYVGKTENTLRGRFAGHVASARFGRRGLLRDVIRGILAEGLEPIPFVIARSEPGNLAALEAAMIGKLIDEGEPLVNRDLGESNHCRKCGESGHNAQTCGRPTRSRRKRARALERDRTWEWRGKRRPIAEGMPVKSKCGRCGESGHNVRTCQSHDGQSSD